jgi:hypothetical protein
MYTVLQHAYYTELTFTRFDLRNSEKKWHRRKKKNANSTAEMNTKKQYTLMGRRDLRQQVCLKGQVEEKTTRF